MIENFEYDDDNLNNKKNKHCLLSIIIVRINSFQQSKTIFEG